MIKDRTQQLQNGVELIILTPLSDVLSSARQTDPTAMINMLKSKYISILKVIANMYSRFAVFVLYVEHFLLLYLAAIFFTHTLFVHIFVFVYVCVALRCIQLSCWRSATKAALLIDSAFACIYSFVCIYDCMCFVWLIDFLTALFAGTSAHFCRRGSVWRCLVSAKQYLAPSFKGGTFREQICLVENLFIKKKSKYSLLL